MSCKFLTGFLVVVEVKIWSVEIGADLVQMKSEFPEASFLQGFLRVFLVQIWLSPLTENHRKMVLFFLKFIVDIDIFYHNIYYIYEFCLYI